MTEELTRIKKLNSESATDEGGIIETNESTITESIRLRP